MKIPAAKIHFSRLERSTILERIDGILDSGQLTLGEYTKEFEELFAKCVGTEYAIAVNSGTSALEISLRSIDIKNCNVIVPTNTFFATPASVIHAGGIVRFGEIDEYLSLDNNQVLNSGTKAIILVHIGGLITPELKAIQDFCKDNNLYLIEDAAHAHGSSFENSMAGSLGDVGTFSFYPTKIMTSGEGGMITTDNKKIYERALIFRDQGKAGFLKNVHTEMGYNWRMSEIHAVLGMSQLVYLDKHLRSRRHIAKIYDKEIQSIPRITALEIPTTSKSNYYKYVAFLDDDINRQDIKEKLKEKYDVSLSGEVYELPCHLQPIFKKELGYKEGDFPIAEKLCRQQICLPLYNDMTNEEVKCVTDSLRDVLK